MSRRTPMSPSGEIEGLSPKVLKIGRVAIGYRNRGNPKPVRDRPDEIWYPPSSTDAFMIYGDKMDEAGFSIPDGEMMALLGCTPEQDEKGNWHSIPELREIPIIFTFNENEGNYQSSYTLYSGKKKVCSGNGKLANRLITKGVDEPVIEQVDCPCDKLDEGLCKPFTKLSFTIAVAPEIGGAYTFTTSGWNTTRLLKTSIDQLKAIIPNGLYMGIELLLRVTMEEGAYINKTDGKEYPTTYPVVTLHHKGNATQLIESSQRVQKGIGAGRLEQEQKLLDKVRAIRHGDELAQGHEAEEFAPQTMDDKIEFELDPENEITTDEAK